MRSLAPVILSSALAACSFESDGKAPAGPDSADSGAVPIACALRGSREFVRACMVEKARIDGAMVLIVRHPDGGFRRFEVLTDGRGLAAADGAVEARGTIVDERLLEIAVGADRYRFPATIGGNAPGA